MKTPLKGIPFPMLLLLALGAFIAVACRQKDLDFGGEDTQVTVVFDWQNAPHADPEGMTLLFFPADGRSQTWRFDIAERDGGPVELLSGVYNVVAFNNDLPGTDFIHTDNFHSISATPRSLSDSLTAPTGMLYSAAMTDVAIFPHEGLSVIRLMPDSISTLYSIRIDSVSGTQRIKTATAILHGPARSVCLSTQRNSADSCSMAAQLHIDPNHPDRLATATAALGCPDIADPRFQLDIVVTTAHGSYSKTFDVTDQVVNSKTPKRVDIHIKGLVIPESDNPEGSDGVGISVGVDGWQIIEINYS